MKRRRHPSVGISGPSADRSPESRPARTRRCDRRVSRCRRVSARRDGGDGRRQRQGAVLPRGPRGRTHPKDLPSQLGQPMLPVAAKRWFKSHGWGGARTGTASSDEAEASKTAGRGNLARSCAQDRRADQDNDVPRRPPSGFVGAVEETKTMINRKNRPPIGNAQWNRTG